MILVVSSATDATATYVCEQLEESSIPFLRFDTESFPQKWRVDWRVTPSGQPVLLHSDCRVDLAGITSVWYRRPAPPAISDEVTEPAVRAFARDECERALSAIWAVMTALWVNQPTLIRDATRKPEQLQRAVRLGFSVPDTLVSSHPDSVYAFWVECRGDVVFKTLHQDAIEIRDSNFFAFAGRLTEERLASLPDVALAPAIFQRYVRPKLEVRVTVIGTQVFAAPIDTKGLGDVPDWRRFAADEQHWEPHHLPAKVERLCLSLIRSYGLHFGAIDLILTERDEYVFLELNANGQWVWIELITGQPLSAALVDSLKAGVAP